MDTKGGKWWGEGGGDSLDSFSCKLRKPNSNWLKQKEKKRKQEGKKEKKRKKKRVIYWLIHLNSPEE